MPNIKDLENCNFYIITVPTPVNEKKEPNLDFLTHATSIVAESLKN